LFSTPRFEYLSYRKLLLQYPLFITTDPSQRQAPFLPMSQTFFNARRAA